MVTTQNVCDTQARGRAFDIETISARGSGYPCSSLYSEPESLHIFQMPRSFVRVISLDFDQIFDLLRFFARSRFDK